MFNFNPLTKFISSLKLENPLLNMVLNMGSAFDTTGKIVGISENARVLFLKVQSICRRQMCWSKDRIYL